MSATAANAQPVQMWNGLQMTYVTEPEAKAMEKAGTHERTRGQTGDALKRPEYFQAAAMMAADLDPPKAAKGSKKPPRRASRKQYHTTNLKAE